MNENNYLYSIDCFTFITKIKLYIEFVVAYLTLIYM